MHAATARMEHDWGMQSWLAAIHINMRLKKGVKRIQPNDINPLRVAEKKNRRLTRAKFEAFCNAFINKPK